MTLYIYIYIYGDWGVGLDPNRLLSLRGQASHRQRGALKVLPANDKRAIQKRCRR